MRKRFVEVVTDFMEEREDVVLILGDISVFAFKDLFAKYPDRCFNVGINEQAMIGMAAGMAKAGKLPIVHTIASFLVSRAYEFIKVDFGYQNLKGIFVSVGASYDYASLGCTHHAPEDVELIRSIPGINIVLPSEPNEFADLFGDAVESEQSTYIRLAEIDVVDNVIIRSVMGKAWAHEHSEHAKALIIAIGPTIYQVMAAVPDLDVTVLHFNSVVPFDSGSLIDYLPRACRVLVVEPYYVGTIASEIVQALAPIPIAISSIGVPRQFLRHYGTRQQHDQACGITVENIRMKLKELINA